MPSSLNFSVLQVFYGTEHVLVIFILLTSLFFHEVKKKKKPAGKTFTLIFKTLEYHINLHFYQGFWAFFCLKRTETH